jgi:hypothetical protein
MGFTARHQKLVPGPGVIRQADRHRRCLLLEKEAVGPVAKVFAVWDRSKDGTGGLAA